MNFLISDLRKNVLRQKVEKSNFLWGPMKISLYKCIFFVQKMHLNKIFNRKTGFFDYFKKILCIRKCVNGFLWNFVGLVPRPVTVKHSYLKNWKKNTGSGRKVILIQFFALISNLESKLKNFPRVFFKWHFKISMVHKGLTIKKC